MKINILLSNFIFKHLMILMLIFNINECYSQNSHLSLVKNALIYGNYSYGIDISDTNSIVQIIYDNNLFIDTIRVQFDKLGRILHIESPLEESWYSYSKNIINKKIVGTYGGLLNDNCYSIDYFLNSKGQVDSALASSSTQRVRIDYLYSTIDNIIRVEISDSLKISNRIEIFCFDDHSFQKWETLNNFGGLSLNFFRDYNSKIIKSKIKNDTGVMYGILEPDFSKENSDEIYLVKNYQGDVLATVSIIR